MGICSEKKSKEPGGYIQSIYFTCTAGIFGTCDHVTGMLFCIDNAKQTGLTAPGKNK